MSEHHCPPTLMHDYRTHELLQAILRSVDQMRDDVQVVERLQRMENLLQTQGAMLGLLIKLLTPPKTYPQAVDAVVETKP